MKYVYDQYEENESDYNGEYVDQNNLLCIVGNAIIKLKNILAYSESNKVLCLDINAVIYDLGNLALLIKKEIDEDVKKGDFDTIEFQQTIEEKHKKILEDIEKKLIGVLTVLADDSIK